MRCQPLLAILLLLPATAAADCTIPESIAGKTFINAIDERFSPDNPNAGGIVKLQPGADGTYMLSVLNRSLSYTGTYTYSRLTEQVAQVHMIENFPGQPTDYNLTLICLNDTTGTLVFTQNSGAIKPERRQNTGRYTLVN